MTAPWWVYLAMAPAILAAPWVLAEPVTWPYGPRILLPRWRDLPLVWKRRAGR